MFTSWLLKYLDVKGISTWQSSDSVSSLILSEFDWLTINFACKYIHNEIDLQEDYTGVGALVLKRFREEGGLDRAHWKFEFWSGIQIFNDYLALVFGARNVYLLALSKLLSIIKALERLLGWI